LSYGLPVVTIEQADIPFLEDYKAGYVVRRRKNEVVQAVQTVLKNRNRMKLHAKKLVKEQYLVRQVVQKLLQFIKETIRKRS
jgi:glycosyltransferase involved in cell wall biosynthesis